VTDPAPDAVEQRGCRLGREAGQIHHGIGSESDDPVAERAGRLLGVPVGFDNGQAAPGRM
jgi:hypothetical protein